MFTGIVEGIGTVAAVRTRREGGVQLAVAPPFPAAELEPGASVAVDGACLTVARRTDREFFADVIPETLARTTLGQLRPGDSVNLERSRRLGQPLDGHWVLGHVDGVVEVLERLERGDDVRLWLGLPPSLARYVALKGCVALQGVSLTVCGLREAAFEVALIPETCRRTTLAGARPGGRLNLEVDIVARYLERLLEGGTQR